MSNTTTKIERVGNFGTYKVTRDASGAPLEAERIEPRQRVLLMAVREALLLSLGALEDYLDLPRTKEARRR